MERSQTPETWKRSGLIAEKKKAMPEKSRPHHPRGHLKAAAEVAA